MDIKSFLDRINDDKKIGEEYISLRKKSLILIMLFIAGGAYLPVPLWFLATNNPHFYMYFIPLFILLTPYFLLVPRFNSKAMKMCWDGWFSDPGRNLLRESPILYSILGVAVEDAIFLFVLGLMASAYMYVFLAPLILIFPLVMLKRRYYDVARYFSGDAEPFAKELAKELDTRYEKISRKTYRTYNLSTSNLKIKVMDLVKGKTFGVEISEITDETEKAAITIVEKIDRLRAKV